MIIKGCHLQKETVLEVGKFAILWNWFERSWCNNECNSTKIKCMANTIPIDVEKQAHLAEILNQRRHLFRQLTMEYINDSLHPKKAIQSSNSDKEIMQQFIEQTGDEQTCGCLLVLYRIRNNLMHGMKLLEELDGQIELFRAATAVLESISEPCWSRH